jgi:hypothetical protein
LGALQCRREPGLRNLPNLHQHFIVGDQLSWLDCTIGVHERIVQLGQLLGRELDLVVVETVAQALDKLGAIRLFLGDHRSAEQLRLAH